MMWSAKRLQTTSAILCICFNAENLFWQAYGFSVVPTATFRNEQSSEHRSRSRQRSQLSSDIVSGSFHAVDSVQLDPIVQELSRSLDQCSKDLTKVCKVKVAPVSSHRLGLVATESISKAEVVLSLPYDERYELKGTSSLFQSYLPDSYDSWTGESGMIALLLLNEVALSTAAGGIPVPNRPPQLQDFMKSWVLSLPSPFEMAENPLLWSEDDQEVLQSSSTTKIYKILDDIEEDALWLVKNVFSKNRSTFPETVTWNGETIPCFNVDGIKWAMALSRSRSFFLDGTLRLMPLLDMCNHADDGEELRDGNMGTFGTIKGAQLVASKSYKAGDEVFCSYGPKSAADYLLEYGFCPEQSWKSSVSEITIELDSDDRFYNDKLDILEFETYDQAPMDPVQTFDVISAPGRDGEPDKAMIQFARLCMLGSTDAFLLESVFRQECWGFMELPVSEKNELDVVNIITEVCQKALAEFKDCPEGGPSICKKLRESEHKALSRTVEYLQREKEALDLKEYYQERRLKELGLDSTWSPEDDMDPDRTFGQARAPGGADYDW